MWFHSVITCKKVNISLKLTYFKIDDDTLFVKIMQNDEKQVQVNIISKKQDDEIFTYDVDLPKDINLLADVDNLLKDTKVIDQLKKVTGKFDKEDQKKSKETLR